MDDSTIDTNTTSDATADSDTASDTSNDSNASVSAKTDESGTTIKETITSAIDEITTDKLEISGGVKANDSDNSFFEKMGVSETTKISDLLKLEQSESIGVEIPSLDKTKVELEGKSSITVGTDNTNLELFEKDIIGLSADKGVQLGVGSGFKFKSGIFTHSHEGALKAGFDGKKGTLTSETKKSTKIGGGKTFFEGKSSQSSTVGTDGSLKTSDTTEGKLSLGGFEVGGKHTSSHETATEKDDHGSETTTDTETTKDEVSAAVPMGSGVKMRQSVGVENTDKISENDKSITEEQSQNVVLSTRFEVDENASAVEAIAAGMVNLQAAAVEKAVSEATKTTQSHTEQKPCTEDEEDLTKNEADELEAKAENEEKVAEEELDAEEKEEIKLLDGVPDSYDYNYYNGYY